MTRREIRDHQFKILFSLIFNNDEDIDIIIDRYFENLPQEEDLDNGYVNSSQRKYKNIHLKDEIDNQDFLDLDAPTEDEINEIKFFVKDLKSKEKDIDERIVKALTNVDIKRIPKSEITILRLCVYEIYYKNINTAISINEAILLTKIYGLTDNKSHKFMNAVLATILQQNG